MKRAMVVLFLLAASVVKAGGPQVSTSGYAPHPRGADPTRLAQVYGGPQVTVGDLYPKPPRGAERYGGPQVVVGGVVPTKPRGADPAWSCIGCAILAYQPFPFWWWWCGAR